jgi:hypothetical protein
VPNAVQGQERASNGAWQLADGMRVEVDPDIELSVKNVGDLRKVTEWPDNLAITTPQERHADSAVKISKVSIATRTAPKT